MNKREQRTRLIPKAVVLVAAATLSMGSADAATQYATNSFEWGTAAFWAATSGGSYIDAWVSGNDATFEGTAGTVKIAPAGVTAGNLTFSTTGYTIMDSTLTLSGTTPTVSLGANISATISSKIIATASGLTKSGAGTLALVGTNALASLKVKGTGALHITGGNSVVTATADNTYFGGVGDNATLLIDGGALSISGAGAWLAVGDGGGTGTVTVASGSFSDSTQWGLILGRENVSGKGTLNVNGGLCTINGAGNQGVSVGYGGTGTVNLNGGRFVTRKVYKHHGTGIFNFGGGTLTPTAADTAFMQGLDYAYVKAGGAIIDTTNYNITVAQPLLDGGVGGGLTKLGTGALTLSGVNTYSGGTTINNGTLSVSAYSNLGAAGSAVNVSGGTLQIIGTAMTNLNDYAVNWNAFNGGLEIAASANVFTVTNAIIASSLTKAGAGTLTLTGTNALASLKVKGTGLLRITGGRTAGTANGDNTYFGGIGDNATLLIDGGTLAISGGGAWLAAGDGGGAGTVTVASGSFSDSTQWGLILGRINASSKGTLNVNGGLCTINGSGGTGVSVGYGGTGTVNLNGGRLVTSKVYKHSGTGIFNFNGGTLMPTAASTGFMQGLNYAYIKAGGAIIDTTNYNITVAQPLLDGDGGGGLTKLGTGTLTLSGANTYTGTTTVNGGILKLAVADALPATTALLLNNDSKLELTVDQSAATLTLNGVLTKHGDCTWGAPGSGARHTSPQFTGPGVLRVLGPPSPGTVIMIQ